MVVCCSVMFDSLQPHGLQPTRLLCPWGFPGKNPAVVCHLHQHGWTWKALLSAVSQREKDQHCMSLGRKDLLEKEMAIHSSILAWETPWTEEPGGLQSMGSQRDMTG